MPAVGVSGPAAVAVTAADPVAAVVVTLVTMV
jgi:hypothetical protein